jgi:hypothetical protein
MQKYIHQEDWLDFLDFIEEDLNDHKPRIQEKEKHIEILFFTEEGELFVCVELQSLILEKIHILNNDYKEVEFFMHYLQIFFTFFDQGHVESILSASERCYFYRVGILEDQLSKLIVLTEQLKKML